jgi:hypothetical protein
MTQLSLFDSVENLGSNKFLPNVEHLGTQICAPNVESQCPTALARRSLTRLEARQRIAQLDELFDRRCKADGLRLCRGCGGFAKLTKHLCSECEVQL